MRLIKPIAGCLLLAAGPAALSAPPLPSGLETEKPELPPGLQTPGLPAGLQSDKPKLPSGIAPPALPGGLTEPAKQPEPFGERDEETRPFVSVTGFWDNRGGIRTQNDPYEDRVSIGETRLHVGLQKEIGAVTANLVSDFIYDSQAPSQKINLNTGQGWIDLREANIAFSPFAFSDIKIGRQILTWGTGDLIFINDLFPKDWQAFFIGRDVEYLKAPSDAVKTSWFSDIVNLDVIFTPQFDADRAITGERLSYYNPALGDLAGRNAIIDATRPDSPEWSLRLYKTVGVNELALYGYNGFWKSPAGVDPTTGKATYPDLSVIGSSIRRPLFAGIANFEMGYYLSPDAENGNNPYVQNSEARFLLGYEQELVKNLTLGLQYYVEWLQDYDSYLRTLPTGMPQRDEVRHVITQRLTWLTLNQNLTWSLFSYFSPSDLDAYLRPNIHYKITDAWSAELGGNFFIGADNDTFFGQFKKNNNIYAAIRFGF